MRPGFARELRATLRLAVPLVLSQLAAVGQNVTDVVLAGHLGARVLGAVAIGASVWAIGLMMLIGVMMALSPSVAQLDGAARRGEVGALFRQALWLALGLGLLVNAAIWFGGPVLVGLIGIDPALTGDIRSFLHAISFGAVPLSLYLACRGLSEGLSLPLPSLLFSLLGLILLLPIGWLLMYHFELGAVGSGIANAIVLWLQLAGMMLFLRLHPAYRGLGWSAARRFPHREAIVGLLRLGSPMAVSVMMEMGLFSGASLLIGRFGAVAVASHQVALSVASTTFMVPLGVAMATTVRVGNAVGRRDSIGVQQAGLSGILLAACSQAIACCVLLTAPRLIAGLYTNDPAVVAGSATLLFLAALFQTVDGVQVSSNGALRGLKDVGMPMVITGFSYWGVGMPLGWYLAFAQDYRAPGMWVGLVAGLATAATLLFARFYALTRSAAMSRKRDWSVVDST